MEFLIAAVIARVALAAALLVVTWRLGAGRSQVQILSPRLMEARSRSGLSPSSTAVQHASEASWYPAVVPNEQGRGERVTSNS